jgi:hypothetical protein
MRVVIALLGLLTAAVLIQRLESIPPSQCSATEQVNYAVQK